MALATLANNGLRPNPKLVLATEDLLGNWVPERPLQSEAKTIDSAVAQDLLNMFGRNNEISEFSVLVLSGPEGTTNAWYLGLIPGESPEFGIVVVLEDAESTSTARQIGRTLLREARNKLPGLGTFSYFKNFPGFA
jgi:cell division protein FtsI/penicillin-binding protein 2